MNIAERWLPVYGFEGLYEVSNEGRVRSLDRVQEFAGRGGGTTRRCLRGRMLAGGPHIGGYRTIHLYRHDGTRRSTLLHIVVAEAFHGPKPFPEAEVRHLDGDQTNCRADNVAWDSRVANEADKALHGTLRRGEETPQAKLTESDVIQIRARQGELQQTLADEFGCTFSNISAIQRRKSWRHV